MPKIDKSAYAAAEAQQGGGFQQLEPGAYVVSIEAVRTEWDERDFQTGTNVHRTAAGDNSVLFVFDIAEGPMAGEFSRDFYMKDGKLDQRKDFMHQLKFGWWNLGELKARVEILAASNPGFDPMAAIEADMWQMFVGKRFGVVLDGTVKTNDRGYDQWTLRPQRKIYSVQQVREGQTDAPKVKDLRGQASTAPRGGVQLNTDGTYDDLPF